MTTVLLGPYATQVMGDMGADVVKIESPEGDITRSITPFRNPGMGTVFLNCNRNKRSVVLNLKHAGAREALLRLARDADVLVTSVRPAAMARLGLAHGDVAAVNPGIVYCGAYGFGELGPYAGKPAYDDIIQAACGLAAIQSMTGGAPRFVNTVLADKVVGLHVLSAIAMALFHRERGGGGQFVEVPMFETMVSFLMAEHLQGATYEPPAGPMGYARTLAPHRKPQATADGHVALLPYTRAHWTRFFEAVGRPEVAASPLVADSAERSRRIAELYELVAEVTPSRTTADWLDLLARIDVPAMPVNRPDDLLTDPHLTEIGFFPLFDHPSEGRMRIAGQPIRYTASPAQPLARPAPRLGQHSLEVLREAGFPDSEIARLAAEGATTIAAEACETVS